MFSIVKRADLSKISFWNKKKSLQNSIQKEFWTFEIEIKHLKFLRDRNKADLER